MSTDGTCLQTFQGLPWSGYYIFVILAEAGPKSDHSGGGTFEVCSVPWNTFMSMNTSSEFTQRKSLSLLPLPVAHSTIAGK